MAPTMHSFEGKRKQKSSETCIIERHTKLKVKSLDYYVF